MQTRRNFLNILLLAPLAACAKPLSEPQNTYKSHNLHPGETPEMRILIRKWSKIHEIPESLLHRVIQRESDYNASARHGPYYGLMQILPQTARGMGYRGEPAGLLDPDTNLEFAGKYLKGAWIVARGDEAKAVMWYAKGYYFEAKRLGLLEETGLRT